MILIRHQSPSSARYCTHDGDQLVAVELDRTIEEWANDGVSEPVDAGVVILQDRAGHGGPSPDDDAESWLRSWSQSGWERFDASYRVACSRGEVLEKRVVVRPSAQGMLSDAVSTLNWCTRGAGQSAHVLLDPMGWLVPSMMRDAEDHLDRIVELCVEIIAHERAWGLLARSVRWSEDGQTLEPATIGGGVIDPGMLAGKLGGLVAQAPRVAVEDASDLSFLPGSSGAGS